MSQLEGDRIDCGLLAVSVSPLHNLRAQIKDASPISLPSLKNIIIIYTLKQFLSNYRLLQMPSFTHENALPLSQEDKDVGNQTQPLSVSCFPCS